MVATAAEVFLDDLLLHMMWGEGVRPEDAASEFVDPRVGVIGRVKRSYHPRLGGYRVDKPGPLHDWNEAIARVRHRVTHAGYAPSIAEAKRAVAALTSLERHAADLLVVGLADTPGRPSPLRVNWPRPPMGLFPPTAKVAEGRL